MKKIVMVCLVLGAMAFSACSTMDGVYGTTKTVYGTTKVVAEKAIESGFVDEETSATLKIVDDGASTYDDVRGVLRK